MKQLCVIQMFILAIVAVGFSSTALSQEGDVCDDFGKPVRLIFKYVPGDTVDTAQDSGKAEILFDSGTIDDDGVSYIVVTDESDAGDALAGNGKRFYEGDVAFQESFEANEDSDDFGSTVYIHFFDDSSGGLLQSIEYHTSCSQPIQLGDVIGNATLVGYVGEDGGFIPPPDAQISKSLISGPLLDDGTGIPVTVNDFDAGGIVVGAGYSQHFKFMLNADGGSGLKLLDMLPGEFDPDPDAEDGVIDGEIGVCSDGSCDGIQVTVGDCIAQIEPHDEDRKLDPHMIRIMLGEIGVCEVAVWAKTSPNPGNRKRSSPLKYEPTSCGIAAESDGAVIYDTITLNPGVKVFDPERMIRVAGPEGSLQLTCNFPD